MYKKLLVPLDGSKLSEQILPYAKAIAGALNLPVELFGVEEAGLKGLYTAKGEIKKYLAKMGDRLSADKMTVSHHVESGDPGQLIAERARSESGTLIAIATHGLSGIQRLFLGSVAYKVVHLSTCPILLVRPKEESESGKPARIKSILVPLDGSALAEKVFPMVTALAKHMNLEVCLIRAYQPPPVSNVVGDGFIANGGQQIRAALRREVDDYLNGKVQALQSGGLDRVSAIAVEGDGAEQIIELATRTPDNIIVMSTHGQTGLGRWVLGSVAEKVIQYSRDPVLLIRPE
jgi:nucleotide-binding universal stress UspA family protein